MRKAKSLSPKQVKRVHRLVRKECCNFDNGNCILLDDGEPCPCPQLISCSLLCRWFSDAVLPLDRELFAELYAPEEKRRCTVCGPLLLQNPIMRNIVLIAERKSQESRRRSV